MLKNRLPKIFTWKFRLNEILNFIVALISMAGGFDIIGSITSAFILKPSKFIAHN